MTEPETTGKEYSGYLVINWRDDNVRFRKTEPSDLSPTEIAVPVGVTVNVPNIEVPRLDVDIDVPTANVDHAVVEAAERIDPEFEQ